MFKSAEAAHPDNNLSNGRLAVIGLGYIGLPTAVVFALRGWKVVGVDVSDRTINMVSRGELPFVEEGLDVALETAVESGSLTASKETPEADVYVVAVPTPFAEDYSMDTKFIDAATDAIVPHLKDGNLVILESTSPPGTTEYMAERILAARPDLAIEPGDGQGRLDVAHAPERVLPGRIIAELASNDRIVGGLTEASTERTRDVYATFCTGTIHMTDARTAEMAKLTENSFRDVNIAFANELSVICDRQGIDVWELISLANRHPRVNILKPGPGVGGHCIAVDPWFIVSADRENSRLIRMARVVNDAKPEWVLEKVEGELANLHSGATIACLGLSFKPDIDDLRESPAVEIVAGLALRRPNSMVLAVEPNISDLHPKLANLKNVRLVDLREALESASSIIALVGHREFRDVSVRLTRDKRLIDICGIRN